MTLAEKLGSGYPNPWLYELAAELADEPVERLDNDPGVIARSLSSAANLFALPAVCVSFDLTVEADAVGCSVNDGVNGVIETVDDAFAVNIDAVTKSKRAEVRIDAIKRLTNSCNAIVLGGVTGPAKLSEQLLATDSASRETHEEAVLTAGDIAVEFTNAYLNAGADGVAILEPVGLDVPMYREAAEPIVNALNHYEAEGIIIGDMLTPSDVGIAGKTGFDVITGGVRNQDRIIESASEHGIEIGIGVPKEIFEKGEMVVREFRENTSDDVGLSSQWTVPEGTTPEAVHELTDSL